MTALCGGGTSSPKPNTTDTLYGGGALAAYYAAKGVPYLAEVALFLGLVPFIINNQCAQDPPAMPTWTKADSDAILQLQFGSAFTTAVGKAVNILYNFLWNDLCKCDNGTIPPAPVPPPPPANLTILNITGQLPCTQTQSSGNAPLVPAPYYVSQYGECVGLLPSDGTQATVIDNGGVFHPHGIPSGLTSMQTVWIEAPAPNNAPRYSPEGGILFYDAAQHYISGPFNIGHVVLGAVPPVITTVAVPATARYWYAEVGEPNANYGNGPFPWSCVASFYCGTPATQFQQQCCSDPTALALLAKMAQTVEIIQRQAAPFAYIPGPVHLGLHDRGELTVSGLLGIKLQPTTIPTPIGQEVGDPTEYFDMGWFTWGGADGFDNRIRLTHSPQVSLPPLAGQFTKIGYSFPPGLLVTATELVREP